MNSDYRRKKNILELTRCSVSEYKRTRKLPLSVVVDNVRSMYNIGSIFRTADAFLFKKIWLCGISGCPPHPEITKTALGAEESVDWEYAVDAVQCVKRLKDDDVRICVLEQCHNSIDLSEFKIEIGESYALVAGNEVDGVNQQIVDMADYVLEIPQCGCKHSLNVSVSSGIAMWHLFSLYK